MARPGCVRRDPTAPASLRTQAAPGAHWPSTLRPASHVRGPPAHPVVPGRRRHPCAVALALRLHGSRQYPRDRGLPQRDTRTDRPRGRALRASIPGRGGVVRISQPLDNTLPRLVESFFREHLQRVRGASQHTVIAYRDALRLLFNFLADTKRRSVADLRLEGLDVEAISAFLDHLEARRRNTPATRNCRLAAIRAFFRHLVRHDPTRAEQYHRVLSLPTKRARISLASYLEPEEVRLVLDQPDRRLPGGRRDHALLLFLYNPGARVSEALDVRVRD